MGRHFPDDAYLLRTITQEYLDGLRRGAHPDSPNGILCECATAMLSNRADLLGLLNRAEDVLLATAQGEEVLLAEIRAALRPEER